jgi:HD-GYP domain-containing protein (c-di-GMP phosphodiesterase class II)
MGGDEFCAIIAVTGADGRATVARAEQALSENGDVFSITSSSGAVMCPTEATDASDALRIADSRMYLRKSGRTLAQTQTRDAVLKMLQERDPSLHQHMHVVSALASRVASRLGLDGESVAQITRAAELHDIGKIALPDAILHKPDSLDAEEWRFVRQYPIIGERILRAAPSLAPIAPLVRSTQERWDGRGYPDGLYGDGSPIGARIVAVCDAYDAMRSGHPYRAARSLPETLAELRRCAGTQFDPAVVDALCVELTGPAAVAGSA